MRYRVVASRAQAGRFHVVRDPDVSEIVAAALTNEVASAKIVFWDMTWREARMAKEKLECQTSTGPSDGPLSA